VRSAADVTDLLDGAAGFSANSAAPDEELRFGIAETE